VRALVALVAILVACEPPTAPVFPADAIRWTPPAQFALWWRMTEACSSRTGDFAAVQWYVVPDAYAITVGGKSYQGFWYGSPDRIVLAGAQRSAGPLVRHEMLHALLRTDGHPRAAFLGGCEGIVACDGECEEQAGSRVTPPANAPELLPSDVATRLELWPGAPAESRDSGAAAVVVSITNPRAEPVWVRLTPQAPGNPFSHTFGAALDYDDPAQVAGESYTFVNGTRFPLGANETRRWVWDLFLVARRWGFRGWFNTDTTARTVVDVGP
jgi:hypothetical protein